MERDERMGKWWGAIKGQTENTQGTHKEQKAENKRNTEQKTEQNREDRHRHRSTPTHQPTTQATGGERERVEQRRGEGRALACAATDRLTLTFLASSYGWWWPSLLARSAGLCSLLVASPLQQPKNRTLFSIVFALSSLSELPDAL